MNAHPTLALAATLLAAAALAEKPAAQVLTLEQAQSELERHNLSLAQARGRAQEARGVVRQAMAALLPTAGVGGSYTRNNAEARLSIASMLDAIEGGLNQLSPRPVTLDRSSVPADTVIQPLEAWSAQGTVRVPLFAGNAWPDYFASKDAVRAAEQSVELARLQLRTALVQAAAWASAAEDIAGASERALAVAQAHEASAERSVKAGTAPPLAHLKAKTEVVRRQSDVVRTRADRERAQLAVGVLLGRAEPVRVVLPQPAEDASSIEQQLAQALARRPELELSQAAADAATWQVHSAWWRLAPQLSASFSGVASDVPYVTGEKYGWKATLDLTWTLYDGGLRYGKRLQAEGVRAGARAALEERQVAVRQQVLDARRDVEVAGERMELAQRQRALATEVAASANRSFEAGLSSSLEVLDANDKLYLAEVGLADAKARVRMARAALDAATGEVLAQ